MTAKQRRLFDEQLVTLFWQLNWSCFGGILPPPTLSFTGVLRSSGGQYFRGKNRKIRLSLRYFTMPEPWKEIRDTLGHEMVHYYLDFLGRPCGHTPEFRRLLKRHGFSRYSRLTPVGTNFIYACPGCHVRFYRKRRGSWSCGPCSGRRFDSRYKLELVSITA